MPANTAKYPITWELDSLLPHPETAEFRSRLERFQQSLRTLADRSESLPPICHQSAATWRDFLREYELRSEEGKDFAALIACHAAADAGNRLFRQWEAQLAALDPLREQIDTNIQFAVKAAGADDLAAFLKADPFLQEIAFWWQDARENARLRLPKEQELLAADLAVDGLHAWGRLYDRVTGDLRIRVMERGELVEKSPGQVQFDSPQRAVRENNFFAADKAWQSIADTCADAINHIAGARLTRYRRLGLTDHLDAPLRYNRMQRETLETMWSVVQARKPVLRQYLDAKARLLGLERLAWYDLTAPLPSHRPGGKSQELSYDDACDMVIDTFSGFSAEFGEFARMAIQSRWIEAENRAGKRQGGFCTGFPTQKVSRIFMTFTNSADSMSTLAHELGHAYHSWVLRDRPLFLRRYPMNLAETASTLAEAVLAEERLRHESSPEAQLSILDNMLADAVSFLMNIHARFVFEDDFHRERARGEVPAARLSELMLAAQKKTHLDALAEDGWNPNFWISKLHFYISTYPFYNFPYTFGYLLSLGLYALAADGDGAFPRKYRELLLATGCMTAEDAVRTTFGHDLTRPDFWNLSLDVVDARVGRFTALAGS